jgi:hypothetical protein
LAVRALYGEPNGSNVRRGHAARSIE